jgi:hypothetical protein
MAIVRIVLSTVFFLGASLWGGALVMLAVATELITSALKGRRTEGQQIVRRLRGIFQKIELIALTALWVTGLAQLTLASAFAESYGQAWGTANAIALGVLAIPTIAAAYSTFYLTGAIRKFEAKLGGYADKNEQIKIRKAITHRHTQARLLTWLKAGAVAILVVVAVIGIMAK